MASSSPSRPQDPFQPPEPSTGVAHIPGMGQYRVSMDFGLAGLQGQYEQGDMLAHAEHHPPHPPPHHHQQPQAHQAQHGQFGVLTPTPVPHIPIPAQMAPYHDSSAMDVSTILQQESAAPGAGDAPGLPPSRGGAQPALVFSPPDLAAWRQRLFDVDDMIVLTDEQYRTYFPHVDNVYSHRSTQRYKRKPFISHYWDCRMKGRPSGTPKSDDPAKKKRKRVARERDLCDVKIKITEYFPGAQVPVEGDAALGGFAEFADGNSGGAGVVGPGHKLWTIQRVNGNGGNGKGDGIEGPHKHTLERSDEIKKSSVQRLLARQEKEAKKQQKPVSRKPTGSALATVRKRSKEADLKLDAACYCPFSQRAWIALEAKGLSYQYVETEAYQASQSRLTGPNLRPSVPVLHHDDWSISDSAILLEYVDDLNTAHPLMPADARGRASARIWVQHINTRLVPAFFAWIRGKPPHTPDDTLWYTLTELIQAADPEGPLFFGAALSLVDIHLAPFALRLRQLTIPDPAVVPEAEQAVVRWERWVGALLDDRAVAATCSGDGLYDETRALLAEISPGGAG